MFGSLKFNCSWLRELARFLILIKYTIPLGHFSWCQDGQKLVPFRPYVQSKSIYKVQDLKPIGCYKDLFRTQIPTSFGNFL